METLQRHHGGDDARRDAAAAAVGVEVGEHLVGEDAVALAGEQVPDGVVGDALTDEGGALAEAGPRSSGRRAFAVLPGTSSTISAEPKRRTSSWIACWKTVIGKRSAHQRVQPCVWDSTQSSTISGVHESDDDERDPLLRSARPLVTREADLAGGRVPGRG